MLSTKWPEQGAADAFLDGGKNYKLGLPPNIPVKDFWSVIVCSDQTRSMLQADQQHHRSAARPNDS